MPLEQIKKQLAECSKERKPVLLYGEDHIERLSLLQEVHKENGGVLDLPVEYIGDKKGPGREIFINKIGEQLNKALIDEYNKAVNDKCNKAVDDEYNIGILRGIDIMQEIERSQKNFNEMVYGRQSKKFVSQFYKPREIKKPILVKVINKIQERFRSTNKSYLRIDCEYCWSHTGMLINNFLVRKNVLLDKIDLVLEMFVEEPVFSIPINENALFDFRGTLFLDNLHCDPCNEADEVYYRNLGNIIKKGKMEWEDNLFKINPKANHNVSVNWLVAYTHDIEVLPEPFFKSV